jgi:hypothetical protein
MAGVTNRGRHKASSLVLPALALTTAASNASVIQQLNPSPFVNLEKTDFIAI